MNRTSVVTAAVLALVVTLSIGGETTAFAVEISPAMDRTTIVNWRILQTPQNATNAYWSNGGFWHAEEDGIVSFVVGNVQADITGELRLGNMTVTTNDTMIARDLALGVWGIAEFSPGLFIKIGSDYIAELNNTAYAAAERVAWNYLNGTMLSHYDNVTLDETEYACIVFEYQQDPTAAGTPQHTTLTYSVSTGVLIHANTSYHFGDPFEPYGLEIEFLSVDYTGNLPSTLVGLTIVMFACVVAVVLVIMRKRKLF